MPSGTCTRKAKTGNAYFHLQTAADVIPLMTQLLTIQWHSTLRSYIVNGANVWDLQIVDTRTGADQLSPQDRQKTMRLGDVAVYDPATGKLSTMRIEQFQTDYTVT